MYHLRLEQFEGPFYLLLQMIEEENLDITEISLSRVTDQYLQHMEEEKNISSQELADFLVIAARLLWLKSKMLLPELAEEEEELRLAEQLKLYRKFVELAERTRGLLRRQHIAYAREKMSLEREPVFSPPHGLTPEIMSAIFKHICHRLEPILFLPQQTIEKIVSLEERVAQLKRFLASTNLVGFSQLISGLNTRSEIVVTFMAVLELLRDQHIETRQKILFGEIEIRRL